MFGFLLRPLRKRFGRDREYYKIVDTVFGISPDNIELYKLALIHRSASLLTEDGVPLNNERLEFLGDAVLEAVVSDYLFIEFPGRDEGFLTQMRSKIVSRATLNQISIRIGLSQHIIMQQGGVYVQKHLFGDALEAMIGAIYLDKGFDFVNRLLINRILKENINLQTITRTESDFKSRLIEWCQKSRREIVFDTAHTPESTAQSPEFRSRVLIDGVEMGYGNGSSKKEAEQHAAYAVSQALSDETGYHLLELLDDSLDEPLPGEPAAGVRTENSAAGEGSGGVPAGAPEGAGRSAGRRRRRRKKTAPAGSGSGEPEGKEVPRG
ncbi:ribonuclease III [Gallalistipes aquisgranensis]|uniref:ribonuclease III n=1 Tax=Gallalistipes aquisgranensis TaxID=2779358 RepID=UPI00293BD785|nr:ribonuclease III [Gallalistipes aquisgranensis]MBE5034076.1 ribonuclease III [Gallalistipes aquisgranensis]